jgi:hypothetical protein
MKNLDIELLYYGSADNELNAHLDACAEAAGGTFLSFTEVKSKDFCLRNFSFADEDLADEFYEAAHFIISKHFGFTVIKLEDLHQEAKWDMSMDKQEGVYHHVQFIQLKDANNFAISLRAVFATYTNDDLYDVMLATNEDNSAFYVIYGFPVESEIIVSLDGDDEEDENYESFPSLNKIDKDKLN